MNTIVTITLSLACSILVLFLLFLAFYGAVLRTRKSRKRNIINYVLEESLQWISDCDIIKHYSIDELHSPIKMNNTGMGNDASDLTVRNYTANVQWLIKMKV